MTTWLFFTTLLSLNYFAFFVSTNGTHIRLLRDGCIVGSVFRMSRLDRRCTLAVVVFLEDGGMAFVDEFLGIASVPSLVLNSLSRLICLVLLIYASSPSALHPTSWVLVHVFPPVIGRPSLVVQFLGVQVRLDVLLSLLQIPRLFRPRSLLRWTLSFSIVLVLSITHDSKVLVIALSSYIASVQTLYHYCSTYFDSLLLRFLKAEVPFCISLDHTSFCVLE